MAYLCPLCFRVLGDTDTLEARCTAHPAQPRTFNGNQPPPRFCTVLHCEAGKQLGYGDLLCRHVGCAWGRNPFWTGNGVSVTRGVTPPRGATQETVSHWELAALEAFASVAPVPEMWFPARLLVPVDRGERRRQRIRMVGLSGAKGVGKTYLAMHALDRQGLPAAEDFIYSFPADSKNTQVAATEFLQTLRLREVMAANQAFGSHLASTAQRPRNLKVAFLDELKTAAAAGAGVVAGLRARVHAYAGTLSEHVHTLMLYDIAGEQAEGSFSPLIHEHDQQMDVLAVVVSAAELVGGPLAGQETGLAAAANRLRQVGARKKNQYLRCALLVTKSDLWSRHTGVTMTDVELRDRLNSGTQSAREILAAIDGTVVDKVFFVHPDDEGAPAPQLLGLQALARWCFT